MKLEKPITKWKPDLGGRTTGGSRLPFFYWIIGLFALTSLLLFPIWIAGGMVATDLSHPGVWSFILHVWGSGVFLYFYVFAMKRDHLSAGLTGVIFMASGFLIGHLRTPDVLFSIAWLPPVLYFLEKLRQTARTRYAFAMILALTAQWLAGNPQISAYTYSIALMYLLFFAWQERYSWQRTILQGALALAAGALLPAVKLFPDLGWFRFGQDVIHLDSAAQVLSTEWLGSMLVPFFDGGGYTGLPFRGNTAYWEYSGYAGVLTLALSIAAVTGGLRRLHVVFYAVLTGLAYGLGAGFFDSLAILNWIPVSPRYMAMIDLSLAVLCGLMFRELLSGWFGRALLCIGILGIGFGIWWIRTWWHPVSDMAWQVPVFVLMAGTAVLLIFWKDEQWRRWAFAGVVALDCISYAMALAWDTVLPVNKLGSVPFPYTLSLEAPIWGQVLSGGTLLLMGMWWFVAWRKRLW